MHYLSRGALFLVVSIVTGCQQQTLTARDILHNQRVQDSIILPSSADHGTGNIDRTLTNDDLMIIGQYTGPLSLEGAVGNGGILIFSGYFGLFDEGVNGTLSRVGGALYDDVWKINGLSGSVFFGPRNTNNISFTGHTYHYPLADSGIIGSLITLPPLPSLDLLMMDHSTTSGYIVSLDDSSWPATGRGDHQQLILTGIYQGKTRTGALIDHQWSIEYDQQTIERSQSKSIITIRHLLQREADPNRSCEIASDMSFGACAISPPSGDAFTSQAPLTLERDTHLASDDMTSIREK